jgi:molybdopterin/thiamine biosynthesis adenylyltransferase
VSTPASYEADILAASQPLIVPGVGQRRVLTPDAVARVAAESRLPRREIEATALSLDVVPHAYLKNLHQFGRHGQMRLLRSSVVLVGDSPCLARAMELLARAGVCAQHVLVPAKAEPIDAEAVAKRLGAAARSRNASCEITGATLDLKAGRPMNTLGSPNVVASCLEDSMEEQLLQFACRMVRAPLVLAGAQEWQGQLTTIRPGDPGVALVYRPEHPHLEPRRHRVEVESKTALMVGAWIAEQVTRLILDEGELLVGRLLFADMYAGDMGEYPL